MSSEVLMNLLLRLLPTVVVGALGLYAATDRKTRERWTELLYQAGSLRPEQKADPKVQSGVRVPFFIMATLLLIWPITYYRHATRVLEVSPKAYGTVQGGAAPAQDSPATNVTGGSVEKATSGGPPAPGARTQPGGAAPAATQPSFNPYGTRPANK